MNQISSFLQAKYNPAQKLEPLKYVEKTQFQSVDSLNSLLNESLPHFVRLVCDFDSIDGSNDIHFALGQQVTVLQVQGGRALIKDENSNDAEIWLPSYVLEPIAENFQDQVRARKVWLTKTTKSSISGKSISPRLFKPLLRTVPTSCNNAVLTGNGAAPVTNGGIRTAQQDFRPEFTKSLQAQETGEGGSATFTCEIQASPPADVVWSGPAVRNARDRVKHYVLTNGTCILSIAKCQTSDTGQYSCSAQNVLGHSMSTSHLTIITQPSSPGKAHLVSQEGTSIQLEWTPPVFTGNASVYWYSVLYRTEDMTDYQVAIQSCPDCSLAVDDLLPGKSYWFRIQAFNAAFKSEPSPPSRPVVIPGHDCTAQVTPSQVNPTWSENILDSFWIGDDTVRGRFSSVKKAVCKKSGHSFAVKYYCKADTSQDAVEAEFKLLRQLDHCAIVEVSSLFHTASEYLLVMHWDNGIPLIEYVLQLASWTEHRCRIVIHQLLEVLQYLHSKDVVHLDIKPENILVSSEGDHPRTTLIDFGDSKIVRTNDCSIVESCQGSVEFYSPEQVDGQPCSTACDMWSIGAVTYVLLSGISPFLEDTIEQTRINILKADFSFPVQYFDAISQPAHDFISSLLKPDPMERRIVSICLQMEWFQVGLDDQELVRESLSQLLDRRKLVATKRDLLLPL